MTEETLQEYVDRRLNEEYEKHLEAGVIEWLDELLGMKNPLGVLGHVVNGPTLRAERPARIERNINRARQADDDSGKAGSWYSIKVQDKANKKTAEVYIYDEIGYWGVTSANFIDDLNEHAEGATEILVRVNSPGGDVYDGIAIGNALRSHPAHVTVQVDALAASAASFIAAMAGDEVVMGAYSEMMIHDASGLAIGNSADMRQMADILDRISDNIAAMYADKAGGSRSFWRDRMRDETWYSAEEAVAAGLADRSLSPEDDKDGAQAKAIRDTWQLEGFAYPGRKQSPPPKALADAPAEQQEPEPDLVVPPIDPDWFRAVMEGLVEPGSPDPDLIRAAIDIAANDAPALPEPEKEHPTEKLSAFLIDPADFFNAIRKAVV